MSDAAASGAGMSTITPTEVAERIRQGRPTTLIDVRTPAEFRAIHAAGAILTPLDRLDPAALARAHAPTADAPLYLLCKSGGRARRACEAIGAAGLPHAVVVEGGTEAWEKAGLPVERGKAVISLERQVRIAAGILVFAGTLLGAFVHPGFLVVPGFVGAGLTFAGITDTCGMAMILARMPWNK